MNWKIVNEVEGEIKWQNKLATLFDWIYGFSFIWRTEYGIRIQCNFKSSHYIHLKSDIDRWIKRIEIKSDWQSWATHSRRVLTCYHSQQRMSWKEIEGRLIEMHRSLRIGHFMYRHTLPCLPCQSIIYATRHHYHQRSYTINSYEYYTHSHTNFYINRIGNRFSNWN